MQIRCLFALLAYSLIVASCGGSDPLDQTASFNGTTTNTSLTAEGAGCSAADKQEYINKHNRSFAGITRTCGLQSLGNRDQAVVCLRGQMPRLSATCAGCFGDLIACSAQKCLSDCFPDATRPSCIQCTHTYCMRPILACTGVPLTDMPPEN